MITLISNIYEVAFIDKNEKRDGRAIRQGNKNKNVKIMRFVTNRSFDAYSWQILENKAKFIAQLFKNLSSERTAEDLDNALLSFAETKACATGDERILKLVNLQQEIKKLQLLEKAHRDQKLNTLANVQSKESTLKNISAKLEILEEEVESIKHSEINLQLDGISYNEINTETLQDLAKIMKDDFNGAVWGTCYGLELKLKKAIDVKGVYRELHFGSSGYAIGYKMYPKLMMEEIVNAKTSLISHYERLNHRKSIIENEIIGLNNSLQSGFSKKDELTELIDKKNKLEAELAK